MMSRRRYGEGLADRLPWDHTRPRMVVDLGQMTVFVGDRRRLQRSRALSTHLQLFRSASGVLLP